MMRIKGVDLTAEPRHEPLVARESDTVACVGVVLERFLADGDADHARAFGGTEPIAGQTPRGKNHEAVVAAGHDNARIFRQYAHDQRAKSSTVVLHRYQKVLTPRKFRDKPYRKSGSLDRYGCCHGPVA